MHQLATYSPHCRHQIWSRVLPCLSGMGMLLGQEKWKTLDFTYPMPPLGAGLVGSSNAPFRVWKNTALDGGLSLSEKQQRLRPKLEFPDSQVYRFRSHVCCYSHLYFSFHFSTISPFYFLRCGDTSEDLELVKSDVRPHARFPILHLVLSLNMIVSSVIHCKAHDAIFFKHLRWYFIVYEYHTICVSDVGYLGLSFSSNCYQNSSKHSRASMCVIRFRFLWVYVKDWYSWLIL